MQEEDDIIAFDEDEEEEQPKPKSIKSQQQSKQTSSVVQSKGSNITPRTEMKSKPNKLPPPPRESQELPEESVGEPVINFSKLFKKSMDSQIMSNSLKVDTQLPKKSEQVMKGKSLFLKPEQKESEVIQEENEPAIIQLEEIIEQPPQFQNEDDVLVIDNSKIESNKDSSRVVMKSKKKAPGESNVIQEDIIEKYDAKDIDDEYSPKVINQSQNMKGGTTEPFPASDENRQENIDTIFSQNLKIGLQSTDPRIDYYGISSLTNNGSLISNAFKMALRRTFFNPILPFITTMTILDASMTSISQWQFLTAYCVLLALVPTIIWYFIYKQELQQEFKADKSPILVFDFAQKRFINRFINRLYPGAFVLLRKGDRIPAPMLVLTSDGNDYSQINYGDETITFRNLVPKLQDSELNYIDGQLEFNQLPLFSNNTKARLRLDLVEPLDIGLDKHDLIEENGVLESSQIIGIILQSSQKQKYFRECLSFNLPLFLNPLKAELFSIGISIVLAITFSVAGIIWSSENQSQHLYLRELTNYNFVQMVIDHLVVYSAIVPVFLEIGCPIFLLLARLRINNDVGLDPQRSGQLSKINSYIAIDNCAATKFINYGRVLNQPGLRVNKATLIGGPVNDEENDEVKLFYNQKEQYEMKPNKEIDQQGVKKPVQFELIELDLEAQCGDNARKSYIFERTLLSLPIGEMNEVQVAIQKYCQLAECVHFAYTKNQKSILLPGETLKSYSLKLIVKSEMWDAYLYEEPKFEEKEESDDEEASDLQQLQDRIKKDRELFEKMNNRRYLWVVNADIEANICKEHPQLANFIAGRAIFEYQFPEADYIKLYKQLGKATFDRLVAVLPPYAEEQLFTQIKPIGVFQFESAVKHNFHLCLDMNLAIIRQWFFLKDIENDATFNHMRQYMECIEFTKDELQNEVNHIKSQSVPILRQSLKDFKVFDNLYKIEDKYICLIVNQEVMEETINGENRNAFLECLMIASFVVFQDLTKSQIEYLMAYQRDQAAHQTIISVGNSDMDLSLCRTNTLRASIKSQVNKQSSLYSQLCHMELSTIDALSKIVLTHARQTHVRQSGFVLFQLYKGFLITICEFFFSFFNGYSSTQLFTPSFHFMYQAYFTSVYGFVLFFFYSDVSHKVIRVFAGEFIKCQRDFYFNRKKLLLIFIDSIYQGFIIFYLPANILQYANNENGIIEGFYYISLVSYMTVTITALVQPLLYLSTFSKEQIVIISANFVLCVFVMFTTCSTDSFPLSIPQYAQHLAAILNNVKSVFIIIFLCAICLTPSIIIQQYEIVSDTQMSKMIHYYEEKEINEDEKMMAEEVSSKVKKEDLKVTTQQVKSQLQSVPENDQSQVDQLNQSHDQLLKQ